jgi:hypothetical protein
MVLLETEVNGTALSELERHGTVHGWIDRYRLVAMTPASPSERETVSALPFVRSVDTDPVVCPATIAPWHLDIIDVMDVEETGTVGAPDPREVRQTGAGVHVAVLDTGFTPGWRNVLPEERVAVDLARAFLGGGPPSGETRSNEFNVQDPPDAWQRDTLGHGLRERGFVRLPRGSGARLLDGAQGVARHRAGRGKHELPYREP